MEKDKLVDVLDEYMAKSEIHSNQWVFGKNRVFFNKTGKRLCIRNEYGGSEIDIISVHACEICNGTLFFNDKNTHAIAYFNSVDLIRRNKSKYS